MTRHMTSVVSIGKVKMGGGLPVVIQSMTNTDTSNVEATTQQIKELVDTGSDIVRITVNDEAAAAAVPLIYEKLLQQNIDVPLVGCFHYNGHHLLKAFPECAIALAKYRINPGNVGFGSKKDIQFSMMIEAAIHHKKPVRIGVNWGSLDEALSTRLMDENASLDHPLPAEKILQKALVLSVLTSAAHAEKLGLAQDQIVISCKVSRVQDLISVYRELALQSRYALHVGLTEAGIGTKGIVATTAALSLLLQEGIGDTIRASLTPRPGGSRTEEVIVCQEIVQSLGLRAFSPQVAACPGCGRTTSQYFQALADTIQSYLHRKMREWKKIYPGVESMNVAVMGCIVNGPGESKHADIGISLPGTGESPIAPVYIDGKKALTLRGEHIAEAFETIIENYVQKRYGTATTL